MKESLNRLFLLLWKNWIILKRRPKRLLGNIAIPLFIGAFVLYIRYEAEEYNVPETKYKPFDTKFLPPRINFEGRFGGEGWNKSEILQLMNSTARRLATLLPPFFIGSNLTHLADGLIEQPKWKLVWSPSHRLVNEIMREACEDMDVNGSHVKDASTLEKVMTVPSEEFPNPREEILAGVVFPEEILDENELSLNISIKIRFPAEVRSTKSSPVKMIPQNWLTGLIFPLLQMPGPREPEMNEGGAPGYFKEGFLRVQDAVSSAILNYHLKNMSTPYFDVKLTRFPYPKHSVDPMIIIMQQFLPFLIVISFLFSVKTMTEKITTEKERRLKIVMNIMGLSDSLRWSSWLVYSLIFFTVLMTILLLVLKVPLLYGRAVLPNSEWTCLAFFFLCYASAATAFCFLISTIFSRAGIASLVSGISWFLLFVPFYVIQEKYVELSILTKCVSSLLLNTGMGIGMHIILMYEGKGPGVQWDNIMKPAFPDDDMTVALSLALVMLDCLLYMCMAFYIENVFPGEYGTPLPWYYPFLRSYWFPKKIVGNEIHNGDEKVDIPFEKEPNNLPAGIQIRNLTKIYGKNKKPAVQNLSLKVLEGQITVLMGFNGAGKTSTLSILTGIYRLTSGSANVAGYDVTTNIREVRKNLGFCPQYNVLFDELTVEEHIQFYGKLKGLDKHQIVAETEKYLRLLNLKDKSKTQSRHLSGGMKRKLSVALAMCGDMKVLIFDEPTAGMDPGARRSLWDILISEKKGRSILITTHYLDEADILGDRIAVMSEGKLICCGSPFFLKKHYSCGYHLKIIKKVDCDISKVSQIVRNYIPEVNAEDMGMELSYNLPEQYSNKFEGLFSVLENEKDDLKINEFGIMPTTLEDIFMRLSNEVAEKVEQRQASRNGVTQNVKLKISDIQILTGFPLLLNQILALFYKHMKYSVQSWKSYVLLFLITISGISNAIFTIRVNNRLLDLPSRILHLKDFPNGIATVQISDACSGSCNKLYWSYNTVMKRQDMNIVRLNETMHMDDYLLGECEKNTYLYRNRHILATRFDIINVKNKEVIAINGWFNALPYHTAPISLANIYNAIFNAYVAPEAGLTFTNEPLPYREETKIDIQGMGIDRGFQVSLFVAFTYIFVSSSFILFPIQEKASKAKLIQMVSGVSAITLWSVSFVWNLILAVGPNLALIATFAAFQEEGFREPEELAYSGFILTSFFVGNLPLIYLASLHWSEPGLGFILSSFFSIITGLFSMLLVMILRIPTLDLTDLADNLDWIFSVFPLFSLGRSFHCMNTVSSRLEMCKPIYENNCLRNAEFIHFCCKVPEQCPNGMCLEWVKTALEWDKPGFGRYILFLYVTGIICFILLLIIENGIFRIFRLRSRALPPETDVENRDSDVIAEREKVLNLVRKEGENYNLILDGISKIFAKNVAVNNLYLAVKEGECFGLLGGNGGGKTTTFRMLTGDVFPSAGNAYMKGLSLSNDLKKVRRRIGYCPQFDALIEDLTGREHLRLFCLIRGVPYRHVEETLLKLAHELCFEEFLDKRVREYSGGNKRKLSTAIALIGNPPIVYLDEPTAGIDPVAKRHLWSVINRLRLEGTTVILTSHSMEECEALCTRLTIMVKGEFKCLGTVQYLKNKYGQGYIVAVKIKKNSEEYEGSENNGVNTEEIEEFLGQSFPGAVQVEKHEELLIYRIPHTSTNLSKIFGLIESVKERFSIKDYSVGQTTLEQIFLKFAGQQDGSC